jgi:hypothetical protein
MNKLLIILLGLFSGTASASMGITGHLSVGQTSAAKNRSSTYSTILGTTTNVVSKDSDSASTIFGADITFQSPILLGIAFAVESNDYKFSNGSSSDHELGMFVIPRLEISILMLDLWAGVGIGQIKTTFGDKSFSRSGAQITLDNASVTGSALSPRIGADVNLPGDLSIGVQLAYTTVKQYVSYTGTYFGQSLTGSENFNRSWLSTSLRIGYSFL